jgi:hypothetical protein
VRFAEAAAAGRAVELRALHLAELGATVFWFHGSPPLVVAATGDVALEASELLSQWRAQVRPPPPRRRVIPRAARPVPPVLEPHPLRLAEAVADPPPAETHVLNFTIEEQSQNMWCWLAVTASISWYYRGPSSTWSQCNLANTVLGQVTCCANPSSAVCNVPGNPAVAMQTAGVWSSTTSGSTPTWLTLRGALVANQPIATGVLQGGAVGHAQVIYGFSDPGTLYVADPWPGIGYFASDYTGYPGPGSTWGYTFWSKKP